jgi:AAA+ ATPase superfamily predicted ATPase
LPSVLQNMWDHHLKGTQIFLVLAGSHIGVMTGLLHYHAPLYGRFTAHLHLKPLPFATTAKFLPHYPAAERVAVYAILGGIPAYLERFDGALSLADNVKRHIFRPIGIFRIDPIFLLQDQVREPRNYLSVLHAIGVGAHTLGEIAEASGLPKQNASTYLGRLADLYLAERRTPVTLRVNERERSRSGRWHLSDSYLRFYFRFIIPSQRALELELVDAVWADMHEQLRAFVGMTAFEELGRDWILAQARSGRFAFAPEDVGSHWSADVQVDVVAINWREKAILLGECKWGIDVVGRGLIRELIETKMPKVMGDLPDRGEGWAAHYAFFARTGFTEAAQAEVKRHQVTLVPLSQLDDTLRAAAEL